MFKTAPGLLGTHLRLIRSLPGLPRVPRPGLDAVGAMFRAVTFSLALRGSSHV